MKYTKFILSILIIVFLLAGCAGPAAHASIAATTLPVYEFTARLCDGTGLSVTRLVTESVSCLHDYSLNVRQVRAAEAAGTIVISGAGLEEFMEDLISPDKALIDASVGVHIHDGADHNHDEHGHEAHSDHHHETDPHIWLSPENAIHMAENICAGLSARYPGYCEIFEANLVILCEELRNLQTYGQTQLQQLSCRELVTFHDGFSYLAESFGLTILKAVEEESGSEASAEELKELITLVREHQLPAVFTEVNGSVSAASVICAETGVVAYSLDMAMSGNSYFDAMYRNIDTLKEALG